jgi:hypothetical protein
MDASRGQGAWQGSERLHFDLSYKRLERGRFTFPSRVVQGAVQVEIDAHELSALLEGLESSTAASARRWSPLVRPTLVG